MNDHDQDYMAYDIFWFRTHPNRTQRIRELKPKEIENLAQQGMEAHAMFVGINDTHRLLAPIRFGDHFCPNWRDSILAYDGTDPAKERIAEEALYTWTTITALASENNDSLFGDMVVATLQASSTAQYSRMKSLRKPVLNLPFLPGLPTISLML